MKHTKERLAVLYGRAALGSAFLSAVAGRFGLWTMKPDLHRFAEFTRYTADVRAISFGIKSPLDDSVFSASAAALLLALHDKKELR